MDSPRVLLDIFRVQSYNVDYGVVWEKTGKPMQQTGQIIQSNSEKWGKHEEDRYCYLQL